MDDEWSLSSEDGDPAGAEGWSLSEVESDFGNGGGDIDIVAPPAKRPRGRSRKVHDEPLAAPVDPVVARPADSSTAIRWQGLARSVGDDFMKSCALVLTKPLEEKRRVRVVDEVRR